jgi:penicillin amidase
VGYAAPTILPPLLDVLGHSCGADVVYYLLEQTAIVAGVFGDLNRIVLDPNSGWFTTDRDTAFAQALEHALAQPARPWSKRQRFTFSHMMFGGRLPKWMGFDRGPYALRGGRATIHQGQVFAKNGRTTSWLPPTSPTSPRR